MSVASSLRTLMECARCVFRAVAEAAPRVSDGRAAVFALPKSGRGSLRFPPGFQCGQSQHLLRGTLQL